MFSDGQLIFAIIFVIAFVAVMIFAYRKDLKWHKRYYKGSIWVLIGFIAFMGILLLLKYIMKH